MPRPSVNQYCFAVSAVAIAVGLCLLRRPDLAYVTGHPLAFALLSAGVAVAEMLPVKIARRGNDEEIVLSTSFSLALLIAGGVVPAVIAQGAASVSQDLLARRPLSRVCFNLAQYTLSLAAGWETMRVLSAVTVAGSAHPFSGASLPEVILSASVFFIANTTLVGVAVAIHQRVPLLPYFRANAFFVVATGSVLVFLAPIVVAAAAYSALLIPLFLAPLLAIYHAGRTSVASEHAARHDSLTGLLNRSAFRALVGEAIRNGNRAGCILLMDLDRFKDVNDTLGHHYGDVLLTQVAARVRRELGEEDELARLGGDEFAIFSPRADEAASLRLARAVARSLSTPFELEQFVVDAEASVGVALSPRDGTDVETLLQRADVAMYRAKETHTDVAVYDERHDDHSPAKLALTADLRRAVESDEIIVWYQPELDLKTGHVTALEALVRWQHPDLGLLSPAAFLEMAERTNLIRPLTYRVLEQALAQTAYWRSLGMDVTVAVNVSARVLVEREFIQGVASTLRAEGLPASALKLEVTESTLMADPELARSVLRALSALGIELAIDDYGTGYSSLAYLADLPVSEVKVDRTFVSRMMPGSRESIIVSSTIDLAHHLGLRAVAEGVEDLALVEELQRLECDMAQGYGISRPMCADEATKWLLRAARFPVASLLEPEAR